MIEPTEEDLQEAFPEITLEKMLIFMPAGRGFTRAVTVPSHWRQEVYNRAKDKLNG